MPTAIQTGDLPAEALLGTYQQQGAYTDCYFIDLPGTVTLPRYVEAFYTTPLFKVERGLLQLVARKPSTDEQAAQLAQGQRQAFAAWTVEGRAPDQLLLREFTGRTRSWLMVRALARPPGASPVTRVYFGTAVVPVSRSASGQASFGAVFHALSGVHRLYSRALMSAVRARLTAS